MIYDRKGEKYLLHAPSGRVFTIHCAPHTDADGNNNNTNSSSDASSVELRPYGVLEGKHIRTYTEAEARALGQQLDSLCSNEASS